MSNVRKTTPRAALGKPRLEWDPKGDTYGLVAINREKADGGYAYVDAVSRQDYAEVELRWAIDYNGSGTSASAVVDGVVDPASTISLTPNGTGTQSGTVTARVSKAGPANFQVQVNGSSGETALSAARRLTIFDTLPAFAQSLPNNASPNNKPHTAPQKKVVGAYYATWAVYGRAFTVDQVPIENLTHILYAFIPINAPEKMNLSLAEANPGGMAALDRSGAKSPMFTALIHDHWGEMTLGLPGTSGPLQGVLGQMQAAKKRKPDLKILPSVGGWTLSDPFFFMENAESRKTFVDSCEELLETWKFFDGIDIDWEFPGGMGANPVLGAPGDGPAYVTLLKELRAMLDRLGAKRRMYFELTSAIGAGADKIRVIDYSEASKYLDYIFAMTYDFYGAWDMSNLGHQTALYAPSWRPDTSYTTENGVNALLSQNVPPEKIVVGCAMYGRGWSGVHSVVGDNPFTGIGSGPVKGSWEPGILDYKEIAEKMVGPQGTGVNGFKFGYDENAEAPYVFNASTGDLVTFDNKRSVIAKGKYVNEHSLGGLFAWEIDADNGDILNAMHEGLNQDVPANKPVADAGADIVAQAGGQQKLDGSNSRDSQGGKNLTYLWSQVSGTPVTLRNPDADIVFVDIPTSTDSASYTFELKVTDKSNNATARDSVQITKLSSGAENQPPIAKITGPAKVDGGARVSLSGARSTDPEGKTLTYLWTVPDTVTLVDSTKKSKKINFDAPASAATPTNLIFGLMVSDGVAQDSTTFTVVVAASTVEPPPVGTDKPIAKAGEDIVASVPGRYELNGSQSRDSSGGNNLGYHWAQVSGTTLEMGNPDDDVVWVTVPDQPADAVYDFELTVTDKSNKMTATDTVEISRSGAGTGENRPPVARITGPTNAVPGAEVRLSGATSSDPDNNPLTYRWVVPTGITLTSGTKPKSQEIAFVAPAGQSTAQVFTFKLTVDDGLAKGTAKSKVTVAADTGEPPPEETDNLPPIVSIVGPANVEGGQRVTLKGSGSEDPEGDPLTYRWTLPAGVALQGTSTVTSANIVFTAPAAKDTAQALNFSLAVSDGQNESTGSYVVTVAASVTEPPPPDTDVPHYVAGGPYGPGDKVENGGKIYECRPFPNSGWCSGPATFYEPGSGIAWQDAWTEVDARGVPTVILGERGNHKQRGH